MPALTAGGPAIVHFIDFAQLNSVRTLPYLGEWARRYRERASRWSACRRRASRSAPTARRSRRAWRASGVEFPVAIDAGRDLWHVYGCEGWPSLFLWAMGGALTWVHFGEGEYLGTEMAIQEELREIDALRPLPETMAPLRPEEAPNAQVIAPSAEVFPGGGWERPWIAGEDADELVVEYEAGGAWATIEGFGSLDRRGRRRAPRRARDPRAGDLRAGHARASRKPHRDAHPRGGDERLVGELRPWTAVGRLRGRVRRLSEHRRGAAAEQRDARRRRARRSRGPCRRSPPERLDAGSSSTPRAASLRRRRSPLARGGGSSRPLPSAASPAPAAPGVRFPARRSSARLRRCRRSAAP